MTRFHAYDLDETLRPGNLTGDAIVYGIREGFFDPDQVESPQLPSARDIDYFVAAIAGLTKSQFRSLIDLVADEAVTITYPWGLESIKENRSGQNIVVSHAPDFLVRPYAQALGLRSGHGSYFHTQKGEFSGRIGARHKVQTVQRIIREHLLHTGIDRLHFAASDHINDLPLLEHAETAVVINPADDLLSIANDRGWDIIRT